MNSISFLQSILSAIALATLTTGCGSTRNAATEPPAPNDFLAQPEQVKKSNSQRTVHKQGTAGFEIIGDGKEAFLARLAMIEAAQKTLDFQYFIWADDYTGTVFASRLLAAADRGVKVRLLLDITKGAQREVRTAALAAHPNIQVAFFNPMFDLKGIFAGNPLPVIGEMDRMQSRMHNKMLIADREFVIGGGRNLGDTYFGVDPKHNMRDLDYVARGPVVKDALRSFNLYWDSPLTRRGDPAKLTARDHEELRKLRQDLERKKQRMARKNQSAYPLSLTPEEARKRLDGLSERLVWAEYEFISDPPERMLRQEKVASPVWRTKEEVIQEARHEVIMHAAYLIPQEESLKLFQETAARGVKLKFLTNSFAGIDGLMAMSGIAGRRADVIRTGAEFYELNAKAPVREKYVHAPKPTPLGMHTKGMVVDNRVSFIGSYNMDPRSKYINTETGVIVRSPAFAKRLKSYLTEDLQPENCWHVTLEPDGRFCWTSEVPGQCPVRHYKDPDVPWSKRLRFWMVTHLPIEDLL